MEGTSFQVGHVYVTYDWFTGGTMKYRYDGKDTFSVLDLELDGEHHRTEHHEILHDENGNEYIVIGGYYDYLHCIYANEIRWKHDMQRHWKMNEKERSDK